uniref:Uncharacterized protein n=1 Tax=Anopheles epiroticus TaxID=199890 RepID=A0A182PIX3_9DIPT
MVYSSRDNCNYPVSSLLRSSVSYDPANTTPSVGAEMTSHSLTMVDETIVHDWQISSVVGGVGCAGGNQEALLAAYHQPSSCTPERPLSAGSASTSWSAASGIESATDEFTVNQHHHQQEKQVSSSFCLFLNYYFCPLPRVVGPSFREPVAGSGAVL